MRSVSVVSKTCTPECAEGRRLRRAEAARTPDARARRHALQRRQATIARKAGGPDGELYRFALSLRALRTAADLSVRELATRARIAYGYVPMMEAAKLRALPSRTVLERLARALGTTVDEMRGCRKNARTRRTT